MNNYKNHITRDSEKRSGQPCIRGLRITVADILGYMASGMTVDEVLTDFPSLKHEDVLAAFAFAAEKLKKI